MIILSRSFAQSIFPCVHCLQSDRQDPLFLRRLERRDTILVCCRVPCGQNHMTMSLSSLPPQRMSTRKDSMQCNSRTRTHFRWNPVHATFADDLARSRLTCTLGSNDGCIDNSSCRTMVFFTESFFVCSQCHDQSTPVFTVFRSASASRAFFMRIKTSSLHERDTRTSGPGASKSFCVDTNTSGSGASNSFRPARLWQGIVFVGMKAIPAVSTSCTGRHTRIQKLFSSR